MGNPGVDVPEIADRLLRERFTVEIAIRPELRRDRKMLAAAGELGFPDLVPPAFVRGKVPGMFGGARIGNLRALAVADAGLEVEGVLCAESEDFLLLIEDEALCHNNKMTEVTGEFQIRNFPQNVSGRPGAVEVASPMCFGGNGDAVFFFQKRDLLIKRDRFGGAPGVAAAHGIEEQRFGGKGVLDALAQRGKVFIDGPSRSGNVVAGVCCGGNLRDIEEIVPGEGPEKFLLRGRFNGERGFEALESCFGAKRSSSGGGAFVSPESFEE